MAILGVLFALFMAPLGSTQPGKNVAADEASTKLLNARSVFVSNLGEDTVDMFVPGGYAVHGVDQPYNYLYAALQNWGRYQIVLDPADADLVLEVRYRDPADVPPPWATHQQTVYHPQLSLTVRDAKTRDVLKDFTEEIPTAILPSNRAKNFAQSIVKLLSDMAKAAGCPLASFTLPNQVPVAPVPIKILSAKKLFIIKPAEDRVHGDPQQDQGLYEQVMSATKTWGQYELTASAEEADIIWAPCVYDGSLRMDILDPKTQILLWGIYQPVNWGLTSSGAEKHIDEAAVALLNHASQVAGKTAFGLGPAPDQIISPSTDIPLPITISAPATAKSGSAIRISATVKNTAKFDIRFEYPSGDPLTCVVAVRDAAGNPVADTDQGRKLKAEHTSWQGQPVSYALNPGESQTRECAVSDLYDMSPPGKYSIQVQQLDGRAVHSNVVTVTVGR
jgi:hypothetical protein